MGASGGRRITTPLEGGLQGETVDTSNDDPGLLEDLARSGDDTFVTQKDRGAFAV